MVGDKIRFRFAKFGDLRLLSHHDLMRTTERMLRRAELPFAMTGGFHPSPRWVFSLALPLGVVGQNECVELELRTPHDPEEVKARLNSFAPPGLNFHAAKLIEKKLTGMPRRLAYTIELPSDELERTRDAVEELLAQPKVWVDRFFPRPRRVNIRPFLRQLIVSTEPTPHLQLDHWVTPTGTARLDELVKLLKLSQVQFDGAALTRTTVELHDETPHTGDDQPPTEPAEILPLNHSAGPLPTDADSSTPAAIWGLSPNGPVVE